MMMVELLYDLIFADRKTNNRLKLRCDAGFSRFYFSTSNLYYLKCPLYDKVFRAVLDQLL